MKKFTRYLNVGYLKIASHKKTCNLCRLCQPVGGGKVSCLLFDAPLTQISKRGEYLRLPTCLDAERSS